MPFGLGKKESDASFSTDITDKDELEEIKKIANRLEPDEKVLVVAKQSRMKPGGSKVSPDTIFVTAKHIIIRNPSMMGMRENVWVIDYDKISSLDLEKGVFSSTLKIFASGYHGDIDAIDKANQIIEIAHRQMNGNGKPAPSAPASSVADELIKLAKLKEQGVISDAEFLQMKQDLMKKI